jgi:Uma2 family endonuclease
MSTAAEAEPVLEPEALEAPPRPPDEPDEPTYEILYGQRREMPPMSVDAGVVALRLVKMMAPFAEGRGFGEVVSEILFRLPLPEDATRNRRPDVAFVSFDRWPAGRELPYGANAWDVVPDLAVEVVGPSDPAEDLLDKVPEYFRAGVRLVWVIYPKQRQAYIYESPDRVRVVTVAGALDGGGVVPGFTLPLASLFDPPRAAPGPPAQPS